MLSKDNEQGQISSIVEEHSYRKLTFHGNTPSQVRHIIRQEETKHWLYGLRQAEIYYEDKFKTIILNAYKLKKARRERDLKVEKVRWLSKLLWFVGKVPYWGKKITNQIADLQEEVSLHDLSERSNLGLYQDAIAEYKVAQQEKERILSDHADETHVGKEGLEDLYGHEALLKKIALGIRPKVLSAQTGYPELLWEEYLHNPDIMTDILEEPERNQLLEGQNASR